jgi:hypothetical protein
MNTGNFKFDKETLIKHRFWIGLGVFAPFWLVIWLVLWLGVSDKVQEVKGEYAKSVKEIAKVNDPKNGNYTTPMTGKKDKLTDRKSVVWEEVWKTQGNLTVDWPSDSKTPQLAALASAPFLTPVKDEEVVVRQLYRDTLYKPWRDKKREQFNLLAGPMSFDFDSVIRMAPISENAEYAVSMDEIWLNAETVWVKRELLWVLRKTIEDIAYFQPIKAEKEEPLPEGVVARHRFRNSTWELDLLVKRGDNRQLFISKSSTIKNVNAGKRTLPLREVKVGLAQASATDPDKNSHWREFLIEGDPIPWNKAVAIGQNDVRIDSFGFTENLPMFATQVFTWATSPIKQIDAIELGWNSSRTAFQMPMAAKFAAGGLEKAEAEAAPASGGTGGGAGPAPGGTMGGGTGGGNQPPAGAATGKSASPFASYINANRYIQVTPQVRRMAVGIVLAIDQDYMEDLVSQFVNCRLRFQPTQVQWQQDTRALKSPADNVTGPAGPEMVGAQKGGMPMPGPGGAGGNPMMGMMQAQQGRMDMMRGGTGPQSGMGMMMGMQGQMQGMQGRMRGGAGAGGGAGGGARGGANLPAEAGGPAAANTHTPTGEESDPNIVQMALYGIISLYDQYVPPQTGTGTTGAAGATPAPGTATPAKPDAAAPKNGEQPKTDGTPKVDVPKTDGTPKVDAPKTDGATKTDDPSKDAPTPKADDKKDAAPPKAADKKTEEKPKEGDAKKDGEK